MTTSKTEDHHSRFAADQRNVFLNKKEHTEKSMQFAKGLFTGRHVLVCVDPSCSFLPFPFLQVKLKVHER